MLTIVADFILSTLGTYIMEDMKSSENLATVSIPQYG